MKAIKIYSDGGARGNPGPSACAFVVKKDGKVFFEKSFYLGKKTNNQAEYIGVVNLVNWLKDNQELTAGKNIMVYLDSELAVKQLNGVYKIKNQRLKTYVTYINKILKSIKNTVKFIHIPREKNKLADSLLNEELDRRV